MTTNFKPGQVDRKVWIASCVGYFMEKYPEEYARYKESNALTKESRGDSFGTVNGDNDLKENMREGVRIPPLLFQMINSSLPDLETGEYIPIISPPMFQPGFPQGTPEYDETIKELKWFREEFPDFATSEKL